MLRFKNLLEAKEKSTRTGAAANTNGVRHELLVGGVLNHMSKFHKNPNAYSADGESADLFNMDDKQLRTHFDNHVRTGGWADKHMPEHFRSNEGQTPKEVHNRHTTESLDPEEHFKHFKNAVEHVKALHKDLERRGFDTKSINNVAWTSVDGNVNSYMQKNANNPDRKMNNKTDDADLMFTIKDKDGNTKHVGSSLKWGSKKHSAPTAKNNTHKTVAVEKEFGPEHADAIREYQQNTQKEVDDHKNILKTVYSRGTSDKVRKGIYDTDIEALKQNPDDERAKNNINAVDDSYKRKSEAVAGHLHNMLTKIQKSPSGHESIKQFVRNKLQIQNPDFVASRSRMTVDKNNNADSHHFEDHATSLNDHLNNAHHFNIERNGSTINIHAFDKDGKKLFTHKTWTKGNSRKSDAVTKWLHSSQIHDKDQHIQENIGIKISLHNLIENIVSGDLNESRTSFKSALSEKVLEKIEEKKLSRKQKKLDKNHNGKLDSCDFKRIRGEKGRCYSEETEQLHPAVKGFASIQHENWRKSFDPENKGTERIKDNGDGTSGNINVPFDKLHPTWQKENIEAGNAAKEAVEKHPNNIEKASEHVHNEWMKRNPKQDWNASQHVPYKDLPEDEKDKDREHVKTMTELLSNKSKTEQYDYSLKSQLAETYFPNKIFHEVPFERKDEAKAEGMKYDGNYKKWYHTSASNSKNSKFPHITTASIRASINKKNQVVESGDLESQLAEVLNPDQGVKAYIHDFLDSDDSRFEGKSPEQRRKMAIAAFYAAKKK